VKAEAGVEDSPTAATAVEIAVNAKFLIFFSFEWFANGSLQMEPSPLVQVAGGLVVRGKSRTGLLTWPTTNLTIRNAAIYSALVVRDVAMGER
jgi:hypothetical protein